VVGAPLRRPLVNRAGPVTHAGRVNLVGDLEAAGSTLHVAPPARVPGAPPFWL